ncbi:hypothetical protein V6N13_112155 [Hibiscus sabdariffa]|uniref:Uncharacterized protein n=1 Tax=Hibiscus sabdariffa TaxID=183260 RepID=A0ABR1ZQC6_9ROSI
MIISTLEAGYAGRAQMLWKQKDSDPFFLVISLIIVFVIRVIRAIHYGAINWFLKTPISLIGSSPSPFKRHHHYLHLKRCSVSITDSSGNCSGFRGMISNLLNLIIASEVYNYTS